MRVELASPSHFGPALLGIRRDLEKGEFLCLIVNRSKAGKKGRRANRESEGDPINHFEFHAIVNRAPVPNAMPEFVPDLCISRQ